MAHSPTAHDQFRKERNLREVNGIPIEGNNVIKNQLHNQKNAINVAKCVLSEAFKGKWRITLINSISVSSRALSAFCLVLLLTVHN